MPLHSQPTAEIHEYDLSFSDSSDQEGPRAVFAYWDSKRHGRRMPSRGDFDPAELVAFLPQLMLLDVETEPLRFRYRLIGTAVTEERSGLEKRDPTGCYVDEVTHHQDTSTLLIHYRRVVMERKPSLVHGTYTKEFDRPWVRFTRLAMPLSADGETINMLVVMLVPSR
jgi:hypothetical protein